MYLLLISVHGLIRGRDLELGRDADTGGQTKYVVELTRALAEREDVEQVDLVTRRVADPRVSTDYAEPIEALSPKARIVRIDAGPEEYLPKEQLWDWLDSFGDNLVHWLNEQGRMPDLVHSHYADAGYVGVRLSSLLGVPLVHTGHSLGRDKRQRLVAAGLSLEDIDRRYTMNRRVDAEEEVLANADLVITSTHQEIEDQYGLYDYYHPERMAVIPPGTDLEQFHPPAPGDPPNGFAAEVARFLREPGKPLILALSRPDPRKNIASLVEAYGQSPRLQEMANLLVVAGAREDIRDLDEGPQQVLTELLLAMDTYDLYGRMALPKHHRFEDVPQIYRLAAASRGVFVNPALTEPFGLTLLEAAASGLPLVATENGGPVDIIANCRNGRLVDPLDREAIAEALIAILADPDKWDELVANGLKAVREHYSWAAHAETYLGMIRPLLSRHERIPQAPPSARRPLRYRDRALFTDIDQSLLGNPEGVRAFADVMRENRKCVTLGIATGRRLDSALSILKKNRLPVPDVLITSLGTQIHYARDLLPDDYWAGHIDHLWKPLAVRRTLADMPGLALQPRAEQTRFKISYLYDPGVAPSIEEIIALLRSKDVTANVIHSFGQYLDVIPGRASKGLALRYVAQRWEMPLDHILVAGGSGADEDMIRGNTLAVVVSNRHDEELSAIEEQDRIYFATKDHAFGILEAIGHYDFFRTCRAPLSP